jgi:Beta-galactosidase C-terminal domain
VERVLRRGPAASYEFLINHTARTVRLTLASGGRELLSSRDVAGPLDLPPQGVAIVRRESSDC